MCRYEVGHGVVSYVSSLAAQVVVVQSLAQIGDHLLCTQNIYGGTVTQFTVLLKRLGIESSFVPVADHAAIRAAVRPNTKLIFAETIGNPGGTVADLEALAEIAHQAGVPLVVDNTFASPYLCRPIEHGADL